MHFHHVVVATDESDAGRHAVRWGLGLGACVGGRVTVMRVLSLASVSGRPAPCTHGGLVSTEPSADVEALERWLEPELRSGPADFRFAIAYGVPSVEIARFAECVEADLLVLGRKARSQTTRLLLGDTADAVARRSQVPCAFVPGGAPPVRRVLAALDGSERARVVLEAALAFGQATDAAVEFVTVEPAYADEPPALTPGTPLARTERIRRQLDLAATRDGRGGAAVAPARLLVRRGPVVERILETADAVDADVLVVGYHRGGPAGVVEAGSTARRLAHTAARVVMTVPI